MYKFKGKYAELKQWLNVRHVFLSIYLSLIQRRVRSKMTSYSKTATTIQLYDVPRSIAEDPRSAFLQSNLFWQVSCAKSKTKACTEISAWTIINVKMPTNVGILTFYEHDQFHAQLS